ncbi:MAG: polyphosphate:AMP phosphotransferase [Gomphosphaeria aponina SAG 52.96 = DSM 107014]|uniref:Polyphosphate:AMP phosphotransferase n=1 Tax=Gomphosphaeria aponina SAG 52.96 = DSM 107014 TaxID=1521640 RepID=A0A941JSN5_9CHRO|nr:polyphosphate:AMP phosphotransferase [Gomphosphaeria aponina SAG 52.96 = DSM 107014]
MLDNLDLDLSLDKATYKSQIEELMRQLRSLQNACWQQKLPVIVVLEGWAAAGKGALVKKIINYMDPRGFAVHPILTPTAEEQRYPFLWRFWQKLPRAGSMAFFYHSWYTHILEDRLFEKLPAEQSPIVMGQINFFERQLVEDGAVIAKFWVHLSRKELKRRLEKYEQDELEAWRVRKEDWQQAKRYNEYAALAEEMLTYTSTGAAPWTLVEGNCDRWTRIKVLSQLVATITEALDRRQLILPEIPALPPQEKLLPTEPDFLAKVDLSLQLNREEYKQRLRQAQLELRKLQLVIHQQNIPVLILFEGWDAAGKGGAIKRLTDILDPRSYQVNAFSAPTTEEKQYHYLWRFWRRLPGAGSIGIFDRTWYGRVLVERVEGFATEVEWRRAYGEINEFEAMLTSASYVLVKFWLHISPEEQLRRFEERKDDDFKDYKLTEEDWRNREKWHLYEVAVNHAIARTSTPAAPWTILAGNDKYYARVQAIETVIEAIKKAMKRR